MKFKSRGWAPAELPSKVSVHEPRQSVRPLLCVCVCVYRVCTHTQSVPASASHVIFLFLSPFFRLWHLGETFFFFSFLISRTQRAISATHQHQTPTSIHTSSCLTAVPSLLFFFFFSGSAFPSSLSFVIHNFPFFLLPTTCTVAFCWNFSDFTNTLGQKPL